MKGNEYYFKLFHLLLESIVDFDKTWSEKDQTWPLSIALFETLPMVTKENKCQLKWFSILHEIIVDSDKMWSNISARILVHREIQCSRPPYEARIQILAYECR
eukprot:TRINITY_DN1579_c0_g1_i1.p1 TRINITY_DN1579_c0_g1~~TRINITY_DN1579_c0_g1_i1.p1  ORF type:complete len:103 (+),score=8.36 TRINITY_DN1579_c0_g1_i1:403-711(+)